MREGQKESEKEEKVSRKREANRKLVLKALIDPKFRKKLEENPAAALGVKGLSKVNELEVQCVLTAVDGIGRQIAATGDLLLCHEPPESEPEPVTTA